MRGDFPRDVSSGKKRNGEVALFTTSALGFSAVDRGCSSAAGSCVEAGANLGRVDAVGFAASFPSSCASSPVVCGFTH